MYQSPKSGARPEPTPTFYWHDYETTGPNARLDRPSQFAGIRTDLNLNEMGEATLFYCRPALDLLPHPHACVLTGISPQKAQAEGLSETDFADRILQELSTPGTCGVGYNSIRFDDEVSRHLFYRTFKPVYDREWQNGNSRWDTLGLMRLAWALRPSVLKWPIHEDGTPSFRLEDLGDLNGVRQGLAHDALSDVRCTISLARKVKEGAPDLFEALFTGRNKKSQTGLVEQSIATKTPLLHAASFYGNTSGCVGLVMPLFFHPTRPQVAVLLNLQGEVDDILDLSEAELEERFGKKLEEGDERLPIQLVPMNRASALLSANWLKGVDCKRVGFDIQHAAIQSRKVQAHPEFLARFSRVLAAISHQQDAQAPALVDIDLALYDGFPTDSQSRQIVQVGTTSPDQLSSISFDDKKYDALLFRYRARNFPETLNEIEEQIWRVHCKKRLLSDSGPGLTFDEFEREIEVEKMAGASPKMLEDLKEWGDFVLKTAKKISVLTPPSLSS